MKQPNQKNKEKQKLNLYLSIYRICEKLTSVRKIKGKERLKERDKK